MEAVPSTSYSRNVSCYHTRCPHKCFGCFFVRNILVRKMVREGFFDDIKLLFMIHRINIEHTTPFETASVIVLRVQIYLKNNLSSPKVQLIIKIPKASMYQSKILVNDRMFSNEVLFYKTLRKKYHHNVFVVCFVTNTRWSSSVVQPYIVLQDLTLQGYVPMKDKLNETNIGIFMVFLAWFHATSTKILKDGSYTSKYFLDNLVKDGDQKEKEETAASIFLNSVVLNIVNDSLREKIKAKVQKVKHMATSDIMILNHGCFIRSKMYFKVVDKVYNMKLIDFRHIKMGSPAIDFGRIVFTNMPNVTDVAQLEYYCGSALQNYLASFRDEYPQLPISVVRRNILDNLLFSYMNLSFTETHEIQNHTEIMYALDNLGCFE